MLHARVTQFVPAAKAVWDPGGEDVYAGVTLGELETHCLVLHRGFVRMQA